ncbi:MAG: glyoxalase/bleomycin resistance protein/dioxygenase [uncultured bacterium]|nr:MAG: glyoxalase/bleomycin resistance protein/dioxygenase [uncultured bacterium]
MVQPIPEGYQSLTPMFIFKDARKAIDFYKMAFGAEERFVMPGPDGKGVMHAELRIGTSIIMMGEESPQCPGKSAETLGDSPVSLYIYVGDVDEAFRVAVEAGALVRMGVDDMFWGDRMGTVQDPFGYCWSLASHTRELSPEEIQEGAKAAFAKMAEK